MGGLSRNRLQLLIKPGDAVDIRLWESKIAYAIDYESRQPRQYSDLSRP